MPGNLPFSPPKGGEMAVFNRQGKNHGVSTKCRMHLRHPMIVIRLFSVGQVLLHADLFHDSLHCKIGWVRLANCNAMMLKDIPGSE